MQSKEAPVQLVLLGGTGDLSVSKLLPALLDLYSSKRLPENFSILGIARSKRTDEEYQEFVSKTLSTAGAHPDPGIIRDFCKHLSYVCGSFNDSGTFDTIKERLERREEELHCRTNRLFYLAVPPSSYCDIFYALHDCGMAAHTPEEAVWSRILVEKPFGNDLETAKELDRVLSDLYHEEQIYRIDHYLAKESVQNILSFRFANQLLGHAWNADGIESIHIKMHEQKGVGDRANFYEGIGALRDVGQNHVLQMLALVAMREPTEFTAQAIREKRQEVLDALITIDPHDIQERTYRAQYDSYQAEAVNHDSTTETYFEMFAYLSLPEWEGVPFYISAGKALPTAEVSITVTFKDVTGGMFNTENCNTTNNKVTLTISPKETMSLLLNAKAPGLGFQLESRSLSFTCEATETANLNAYEKVLYDCIAGDHTLFTTTEEVLAAWRFISPIIEAWDAAPLHIYQKGTLPDSTLLTNM